jgi:hypothetical protein
MTSLIINVSPACGSPTEQVAGEVTTARTAVVKASARLLLAQSF